MSCSPYRGGEASQSLGITCVIMAIISEEAHVKGGDEKTVVE
jgi:hypothetical protein